MAIFRSILMIPAVASALWVAQPNSSHRPNKPASAEEEATSSASTISVNDSISHEGSGGVVPQNEFGEDGAVAVRKARIQRLLATLDKVAEVAMQMSPERSANLEPVIVDLAERTLELTGNDVVRRPATDTKLQRLEATINRLVGAINRTVDPEVSL